MIQYTLVLGFVIDSISWTLKVEMDPWNLQALISLDEIDSRKNNFTGLLVSTSLYIPTRRFPIH